jgi:predicted MFS family arabinose efflux permease
LCARTLSGSISELAGWQAVYLISASLTLIVALGLFRTLPKSDDYAASMPYWTLVGSLLSLYAGTPVLRLRATLAMLHFAAASVAWTSLALPLSATPWSLSPAAIGLFGLTGMAGVFGAARAGRLADCGLGQRTTGIGLLLMLTSWLPIGLLGYALWPIPLGLAMLDLGLQSVHVTNQSMILRDSAEARSRLTAAYMLFYSVGTATGSIAATTAYTAGGWPAVCVLGGTMSAAALAFWAIFSPRPEWVAPAKRDAGSESDCP